MSTWSIPLGWLSSNPSCLPQAGKNQHGYFHGRVFLRVSGQQKVYYHREQEEGRKNWMEDSTSKTSEAGLRSSVETPTSDGDSSKKRKEDSDGCMIDGQRSSTDASSFRKCAPISTSTYLWKLRTDRPLRNSKTSATKSYKIMKKV